MSARMIGDEVGLTGQEVNFALKDAGLLHGEPKAWGITEKGAKFATETLHQRGTGGYSFMNPSWPTVAWDESVRDLLDFSDEGKQRVRQAVSTRRRAHAASRAAAAVVDTKAPQSPARQAVAPPQSPARQAVAPAISPTKAAGALLGAAVIFGIYKTVPLVRNRWMRRAGLTEQVPSNPGAEEGSDLTPRGPGDDVRNLGAT
jgi:hypothetical protein